MNREGKMCGLVAGLRRRTLAFVAAHRMPGSGPGVYRYSLAVDRPTLYSSGYAARIRSLFNDLGDLSDDDRGAWMAYLNSHLDDDGLYRDPAIFGEGWYKDDPLWCGRTHLTGHTISGLAALGATTPRPMGFLDPYRDPAAFERWLDTRDWGERVAFTGNEICNIGRLLQYDRDFHGDTDAGHAVNLLFDWLEHNRFHPETGLWGDVDTDDPIALSHAIQGAYHWWILYFYDRRPVPAVERTIDSLLRSQNELGSFGWGVHNQVKPLCGSACEDIDSSHPLAQLHVQSDYRRDEVHTALVRAADWVLSTQTPDGGFAFKVGQAYSYGHPQLSNPAEMGGMFPTWFRTLNLALLAKALPEHPLGRYSWNIISCPGPQVWWEPDR
jgi:hypothetical protein